MKIYNWHGYRKVAIGGTAKATTLNSRRFVITGNLFGTQAEERTDRKNDHLKQPITANSFFLKNVKN